MKEKEMQRFRDKYGEEAVKLFKDCLWETGNLSEVARQFRFSRANASLMFKKLYDIPFSEYKSKRKDKLSRDAYEPPEPWADQLEM